MYTLYLCAIGLWSTSSGAQSVRTFVTAAVFPDILEGDPEVLVFHYDWIDHQAQVQHEATALSVPSPSDTQMEIDPVLRPDDEEPAATVDARTFRALFTVSEPVRKNRGKGRVTVRFVGRAIQSPGAWHCARCADERCPHIQLAQERLRILVLAPEEVDGERRFVGRPFVPLREYRKVQPELERQNERCVSYLPRPAIPFVQPIERRIHFDIDYASLTALRRGSIPGPLCLEEPSACRCGAFSVDLLVVETRGCTIYDIDRAYETLIEIYRCQDCDKMSAGPDLWQLGLFNFDNKIIVTHRLIHKYDAYYSGQEGTFAAFVELLNYEYDAKLSTPATFMHVDVFRHVWFSFIRLQQFSDDMICPICGNRPYAIIADGVTVSTQCEKATGLIHPPTIPHAEAPVREAVRPAARGGGTQLVPNRQLRKRCIDLIDSVLKAAPVDTRPRTHRKLVARTKSQWELVDDSESDEQDDLLAYVNLMHSGVTTRGCGPTDRPLMETVAQAAKSLLDHDQQFQPVADTFQLLILSSSKGTWRTSWLRLLRQVRQFSVAVLQSPLTSDQIFCEESALQVVSFNCIVTLQQFAAWSADNDDERQSALHDLVDGLRRQFPCFGVVASNSVESGGELLLLLQQLAGWLHCRTHAVYNDLERHQSDDGQPLPESITQPDWTQVSFSNTLSNILADAFCALCPRPASVTVALRCGTVRGILGFEPMAATSATLSPTLKAFVRTSCAPNTTPCMGVADTQADYWDCGARMACVTGFTSSRKARAETMFSQPFTLGSRSRRR